MKHHGLQHGMREKYEVHLCRLCPGYIPATVNKSIHTSTVVVFYPRQSSLSSFR